MTQDEKIIVKKLNTDTGKSDYFIYEQTKEKSEDRPDPIRDINIRLENIEKKIGGIYESISDGRTVTEYDEKSVGNVAKANVTKTAKSKSPAIQSDSEDA